MTTKSIYYDNKQLKYLGIVDDNFVTVKETSWYENGQKHTTVTYTPSGEVLNLFSWYENGQLKYEVIDNMMDKTFKSWYENGQLHFNKDLVFDFSRVMIVSSEEWFDKDGNSIDPSTNLFAKLSHLDILEIEDMDYINNLTTPHDEKFLGSSFLHYNL